MSFSQRASQLQETSPTEIEKNLGGEVPSQCATSATSEPRFLERRRREQDLFRSLPQDFISHPQEIFVVDHGHILRRGQVQHLQTSSEEGAQLQGDAKGVCLGSDDVSCAVPMRRFEASLQGPLPLGKSLDAAQVQGTPSPHLGRICTSISLPARLSQTKYRHRVQVFRYVHQKSFR